MPTVCREQPWTGRARPGAGPGGDPVRRAGFHAGFRAVPAFAVLVLAALILLAPAFAAPSPVDAGGAPLQPLDFDIPNRPILAEGADDNPPYSFRDQHGEPAGYAVDLLRALAEAEGLDVRIRLAPGSRVREDLLSGRVDVVLGMYSSDERDREVDFTPPHSRVAQSVFVRRGGPAVARPEDRRGREIMV
ncbi:MAG: transporter substrate-binding domain-containing protein, partial [Desulfovibrionaceae bacterium]